MASVKIQDVVVFILVIQGILDQLGSQAAAPLSSPYHNPVTIRKLIVNQAKGLPHSYFQFDSAVVQIVHKDRVTTEYFLLPDSRLSKLFQGRRSLLVFSRSSIDTAKPVVILTKDEDGLDPSQSNVFVVLKKIGDSEPSRYFVTMVYWRPEDNFPLEWDVWSPRKSSEKIQRSTSTDLSDNGHPWGLDLLDKTGISIKRKVLESCNESKKLATSARVRVIRKRGLFDSVIDSVMTDGQPAKVPDAKASQTSKKDESVRRPPNSSKSKVVVSKGRKTEPKKLLSNRIYLVKPSWYKDLPQEQQGRSAGDGVNKALGTSLDGMLPNTEGVTKKTAATLANSNTNVGKAASKSINNKGGIAVANAVVNKKGDAFASSKSVGHGKAGEKIAVSNAQVSNGGLAVSKAETDGYNPTLQDGSEDEKMPSPDELIKATNKDFTEIIEISNVQKSKRSVGSRNDIKRSKCPNLQNLLDKMDRKFLSQSWRRNQDFSGSDSMSEKISRYLKNWLPYYKSREKYYHHDQCLGGYGKNDLNSIFDPLEKNSEDPRGSKNFQNSSNCSSDLESRARILNLFDLECDEGTKSYLGRLLNSQTVSISENTILDIDSSFLLLNKKKLSRTEMRNLTALVLISSYSSAVEKLPGFETHFRNPSRIPEELKLLTLTIIQAIHVTNLFKMRQHSIKLNFGIQSILESLLKDFRKTWGQSCGDFGDDCRQEGLEGDLCPVQFRVVLILLRFSQSSCFRAVNSVEEVASLFWDYYRRSYLVVNQLSKCLFKFK